MICSAVMARYSLFQSTLPRRERPDGRFAPKSNMEYFNPRSREGSDQRREPVPYYGRDFNPRSREGSDAALFSPTFSPINISIHAPAKGATAIALSAASGVSDFNPRSREGSDEFGLFMSRQEYNFNPRSREGSDDTAARIQERPAPISIHAPAKGATAKITKTIPDDFHKINNCNNSFA